MAEFQKLRDAIASGSVLVPGDEGYEDSLKRWSKTAEKRAVSGTSDKLRMHLTLTHC